MRPGRIVFIAALPCAGTATIRAQDAALDALLDRAGRYTLQIDDRFGIAVPVAMSDRYVMGRLELSGEATLARCCVLGAQCSVPGARCWVLGAGWAVLGGRC